MSFSFQCCICRGNVGTHPPGPRGHLVDRHCTSAPKAHISDRHSIEVTLDEMDRSFRPLRIVRSTRPRVQSSLQRVNHFGRGCRCATRGECSVGVNPAAKAVVLYSVATSSGEWSGVSRSMTDAAKRRKWSRAVAGAQSARK